MTRPGGSPRAAAASAPGRVPLAGMGRGPWLNVAIDRRAVCRVEPLAGGVEVEAKEALSRAAAGDVAELVARAPGSLVAQVLAGLGASRGLRVVTEWKLPQGSGVDADSALTLATVAAVARALGRDTTPDELVALAREAAARTGRDCSQGLHAALWGGVVATREHDGAILAERPPVDPGRVEESLILVDVPPEAERVPTPERRRRSDLDGANRAGAALDALASGRYDDLVGLLDDPGAEAAADPVRRRLGEAVRAAGGAARPLEGRLVLVWAPPGVRGPGRREAVEAALRSGGWKPLPLRLDLLGLELE